MKSNTKLKDEARKHEQREEWEQAIRIYLQVLEGGDDGEAAEIELPLYNRVGDLYVRLNRPAEAVKYYEKAAERYAHAGLFNNAIALCNKALRYVPAQLELLRQLAHFSASQGFFTDARRYFLEYAEKKFAAGDAQAGLSALEDFAKLADDADVRELLGRKLLAHNRRRQGLDELKTAYAMRLGAGQQEEADALRTEILQIEPTAFADEDATGTRPLHAHPHVAPAPEALPALGEFPPLVVDVPQDTAERALPDSALQLPGLEPHADFQAPTADEAALLDELETTAFEPPAEDVTFEIPGLAAAVPDSDTVSPLLTTPAADELGLETAEFAWPEQETPALEEEDRHFELPLLGEERPGEAAGPWAALPRLEDIEPPAAEPPAAEQATPELPSPDTGNPPAEFAEPAAEPETTAADPDFIDLAALLAEDDGADVDTRFVVEEKMPTGDEDRDFAELLTEFKQKLAEHVSPEDGAAHYDLGLAFKEMGLLAEAITEFQVALRAGYSRLKVFEELGQCFLSREQYNIAEKVLRRALEIRHQDENELLGVYYHLGRAYEGMGNREQARDAYERVLGIDINFADVAERIAAL